MLNRLPRKQQIFHFLVGRLPISDDFQLIVKLGVAFGDQHAAEHFLQFKSIVAVQDIVKLKQPQIGLCRQNFFRFVCEIRCHDHFEEDFNHLFRGILVDRTVGRDDSAENRRRVSFISFMIRFSNRFVAGNAAGVGVLDRNDRRFVCVFLKHFDRAVGVVNVVVRQFLALELFCADQRPFVFTDFLVKSRTLMRIFSVAQILNLFVGEGDRILSQQVFFVLRLFDRLSS